MPNGFTRRARRYRRNNKKRSTTKKVKLVQKKTMLSPYLKSYIRSMITRNQELKSSPSTKLDSFTIVPYSYETATTPSIIQLSGVLGDIINGNEDGQRIGNKIRVKDFYFKGCLYVPSEGTSFVLPATPQASILPGYVKMIVFRDITTLEEPTNLSDIFNDGNQTAPPTNLPSDMFAQFNRDKYKIYAQRVFKLGRSDKDGTVGYPNNDFKQLKYFSINLKKHIDVVKYNDLSVDPTNVAFYVTFFMCNADGSTFTINNNTISAPSVLLSGNAHCTYYDA